jgi:hypothetical protein
MASCGVEPAKTVDQFKAEVITPTGIFIDKGKPLNSFFARTGSEGVITEQFLASLSPQVEGTKSITSSQVIVDMSAGMYIGIEKTYDAIKAVLNRFSPDKSKYYHVDDNPNSILPIDGLRSLSDASILTNPENFKKSYSNLKPAFVEATKATDKITIVVTDFLLDEGVKGGQRLKSGKYTKEETANNSTWAKDYFKSWFDGGNRVIIYPFKYTAKNYYQKTENKNIYYIIFEPKGAVNPDLDNLKRDLANSGLFKSPVSLSPADIKLNFDTESMPGECVEDYKTLEGSPNKKALQVFSDYNAEHIPFSYPALKAAAYTDKPVSCNVSLVNNSPFKVELETKGYDASKYYYDALLLSKTQWDGGNKPGDLVAADDLSCDIASDLSLVFKLTNKVTGVSYMSKYQGFAKLLASKIHIKNLTLNPLDESLSWNFESKEGTMENSALKESLHLALDEYVAGLKERAKKNTMAMQLGTVLVSIHDKK